VGLLLVEGGLGSWRVLASAGEGVLASRGELWPQASPAAGIHHVTSITTPRRFWVRSLDGDSAMAFLLCI